MNVEERKKRLVKKHGTKPTITYYYYLWNVVNYCGEKRVRQSFESIRNQGNEVIIGNYLQKDNTNKIAREYGFRIINVEKDSRSMFPESKIRNKIILNSKGNFLIPLNINVEYPKNLTELIVNWIKKNNIQRRCLRLRYKFQSKDGKVRKFYGFSSVFYKPFLMAVRGYDERTSYASGSQKYGVTIMKDIFKLNAVAWDLGLVHKYHNHMKNPVMHLIFPNVSYATLKRNVSQVVWSLMKNFERSFPNGTKKVNNSYW